MREQLWALGLDVPDTQDALHHFGASVRLPGPRMIHRQPLHHTVTGGDNTLTQVGNEGQNLPLDPAVAARNDVNESATQPAIEDVAAQARAKRDDPDKKQYMYGIKRKAPDTTTEAGPSTTRQRLLESRDLMPPPPVAYGPTPYLPPRRLLPPLSAATAPDDDDDDGDEVFFDASEGVGR